MGEVRVWKRYEGEEFCELVPMVRTGGVDLHGGQDKEVVVPCE